MNIAWFREFVVLADARNYLEASEQLFIGQSTLSKHIRALEDEPFITLEENSKLHSLFRSTCLRMGFFPKIPFTCNEVGSILDLVSQGAGVALLMRGHTVRPKEGNFQEQQPFLVKPLIPRMFTQLNLCYLKASPLSHPAKMFLDCAASFDSEQRP